MKTMLVVGVSVCMLCAVGCASRDRACEAHREEPVPALVNGSAVAEILDAVQSELVVEGLCHGGERLVLAMQPDRDDEGVVCLFYSVPDVLMIFRESYVQNDGLVLLADDLSYRDRDVRWSTRPIPSDVFQQGFESSAVRIACEVDGELSAEQLARHQERVRRKWEALQQP
ncbi:MAG: hypothetical protein PVJ57_04365 [Phycisphaerae bacterium]|jgi:hypothetical protein